MIFLLVFIFHQSVDAWRKFANSASKVIMLRNNSRKIYLFRNKVRNKSATPVGLRAPEVGIPGLTA